MIIRKFAGHRKYLAVPTHQPDLILDHLYADNDLHQVPPGNMHYFVLLLQTKEQLTGRGIV